MSNKISSVIGLENEIYEQGSPNNKSTRVIYSPRDNNNIELLTSHSDAYPIGRLQVPTGTSGSSIIARVAFSPLDKTLYSISGTTNDLTSFHGSLSANGNIDKAAICSGGEFFSSQLLYQAGEKVYSSNGNNSTELYKGTVLGQATSELMTLASTFNSDDNEVELYYYDNRVPGTFNAINKVAFSPKGISSDAEFIAYSHRHGVAIYIQEHEGDESLELKLAFLSYELDDDTGGHYPIDVLRVETFKLGRRSMRNFAPPRDYILHDAVSITLIEEVDEWAEGDRLNVRMLFNDPPYTLEGRLRDLGYTWGAESLVYHMEVQSNKRDLKVDISTSGGKFFDIVFFLVDIEHEEIYKEEYEGITTYLFENVITTSNWKYEEQLIIPYRIEYWAQGVSEKRIIMDYFTWDDE